MRVLLDDRILKRKKLLSKYKEEADILVKKRMAIEDKEDQCFKRFLDKCKKLDEEYESNNRI